jgi:uncharacterized coiled-coil protein SlyX
MTAKKSENIRIELESKIAFQEKAITDLNDAFVEHARMMIDLQRRVELLENMVRGFNRRVDALSEAPPDEKPPHY